MWLAFSIISARSLAQCRVIGYTVIVPHHGFEPEVQNYGTPLVCKLEIVVTLYRLAEMTSALEVVAELVKLLSLCTLSVEIERKRESGLRGRRLPIAIFVKLCIT